MNSIIYYFNMKDILNIDNIVVVLIKIDYIECIRVGDLSLIPNIYTKVMFADQLYPFQNSCLTF